MRQQPRCVSRRPRGAPLPLQANVGAVGLRGTSIRGRSLSPGGGWALAWTSPAATSRRHHVCPTELSQPRTVVVLVRRRLLLAVVLVLTAILVFAGGSTAAAAQPLVLHPHFQLISGGSATGNADIRAVSGRYVLLAHYLDGSPMTLLDDETGKRTKVNTFGCRYEAFGPPWILFQCVGPGVSDLWVYNITTHKRTHVPCAVALCTPLFGTGFRYAAVGARWIFVFDALASPSCGDGLQCPPELHTFVNLRTGKLRYFYDQLSSMRIMDLNAPYATRALCQPVMAGAVAGPYIPYDDPVTFYGDFAAIYTLSGRENLTVTTYLERCGSTLHLPIDPPSQPGFRGPIAGNAQAVVWMALDASGVYHHELDGLLLPGLRRFSVKLPSKMFSCDVHGCLGGGIAGVSSRRLYLTDASQQVWAAPFPPAAPSKRKR